MSEHYIELNGSRYATDQQGFLKDRLLWSQELARHMASLEGIKLSEEHWHVIQHFRDYYDDYNIPPPMRMVIRSFKKGFGEEKACSRYLLSLFPEGATKSASKYAGLPKPKNCK